MSGPGNFSPDHENNRRYDVDEPAATVVRQMFRWCAEGKTCYMIKQMLTEKGVNTPSQYKKKKKQDHHYTVAIVQWYSLEQEINDPYYLTLRQGTENYLKNHNIAIRRIFQDDVNVSIIRGC